MRWYQGRDGRDRRLTALWCATVGPPVIQLEPTERHSPWERGSDLDVIAWNVQLGGGDIFRLLKEELGLDCSSPGRAAGPAARPFVLLLQEAWRRSPDMPRVEASSIIPWTIDEGRAVPDIVGIARRCGLAFVYVPSARNGPDSGSRPSEDKGNAILASIPLSEPMAIDLPFEGSRKVAAVATVHGQGGQRVSFTSVHLDLASTLVRTLLSGNQTRARQAAGLIGALDQAQAAGPPVEASLVGGDFNTWAVGETALGRMREAFPDSPDWDGLGTRGGFPADHVFFRRSSATDFSIRGYGRLEASYDSDHYPRRVTLRENEARN